MIISASYKTDIPTFYGEWFMNRLRAGYCKMVNPYNRHVYRVSLDRADVEGFVFWSKNVGPFVRHLDEVRNLGFPFVIQHTINGYPRALETSVVDGERSIKNATTIRDRFGARVLVWRYDTIVFSSLSPYGFHVENFARLAGALRGATDEVVISFAHVYRKTKRNLDDASRAVGFDWWDPSDEEKRRLTLQLAGIAHGNGMQLSVCSQPSLIVPGATEGRCVDARRLEEIAGSRFATPLKGNRKECGCFESRDIGEYYTCPHGCVYCYAVQNRAVALERYHQHDPTSEFLFEPTGPVNADSGLDDAEERQREQLPLFPGR
jgi:hypothetical protein